MPTMKEKMVWLDHTILTSSKGDKEWKVQTNQHGQFRCHCPSYIFSKLSPKSCKHIRHVMGLNAALPKTVTVPQVTSIGAATGMSASVKHPQWDTALAMFDAMCSAASKVTGNNVRASLGLPAGKAMIDALAEKLQTFAPAPVPMQAVTVTAGVRRITFDD